MASGSRSSVISGSGLGSEAWIASCGRSILSFVATRTSTSVGSGRDATRYEVDFYGPVRDAINGDDDTDRLVVEWATAGEEGPGPIAATAPDAVVATPSDIVALRATDAAAAHRARLEVREAVGARMAAGWTIVGVDVDGSYVLRLPS